MVIQVLPLLEDVVRSGSNDATVATQVKLLGWRGVIAMIGLTGLVAITPLPSAIMGVVIGLSYGVLWGSLIFLCGIATGQLLVMVYARELRSLFPMLRRRRKAKRKDVSLRGRLDRLRKPEVAAFFLALIPFISGTGPYLFAGTRISIAKYLLAVVAGSVPVTILYVFLGDRISRGSYEVVIVLVAVIVVVALLALAFRKKIINKIMSE